MTEPLTKQEITEKLRNLFCITDIEECEHGWIITTSKPQIAMTMYSVIDCYIRSLRGEKIVSSPPVFYYDYESNESLFKSLLG